jgi:hypothetical protein
VRLRRVVVGGNSSVPWIVAGRRRKAWPCSAILMMPMPIGAFSRRMGGFSARYPDADTGRLWEFWVSRSRNPVERAASARSSELIPRILRSEQGVDDRLGRGVSDPLKSSFGQAMPIGFQVCRLGGREVDGAVPSVDEDISTLPDFTNHHVQLIDVVVAHEVLKFIPYRWRGGDDQVRVRREFGGVDEVIEISANIYESSSWITVSIRLDGSLKIGSSDGDVRHVRAELLEKFAHLLGHRPESVEREIDSNDRGTERHIGLLQPLDDGAAKQSAGLVAEQEYQSLVLVRSDLHHWIVDRKELQSGDWSSIREDGTSPSGSGTVLA